MVTKSKAKAAKDVVRSLERVQSAATAERVRDVAESIIALRSLFRHEDLPDWTGRSGDYRDLIERLYRQAGMPADSDSSIQSKIRYHVGNVLREMAPEEELVSLGLSVSGPRVRIRDARRAQSKDRAPKVNASATDPRALAVLALDAVRLLRVSDLGSDREQVALLLKQLVDESLDVLSGD